MVSLGTAHGVATVAQLTSMDAPLGRAVGNALEVTESVEVLKGAGPLDVRELTLGSRASWSNSWGSTSIPSGNSTMVPPTTSTAG